MKYEKKKKRRCYKKKMNKNLVNPLKITKITNRFKFFLELYFYTYNKKKLIDF